MQIMSLLCAFLHLCSARSRSGVDCQGKRICCCSQPATSYLSPSARCAPVNGLAGCYVSTIGKPHEYFDLTGSGTNAEA